MIGLGLGLFQVAVRQRTSDVPPPAPDHLLLESGDDLLLEDGSLILLEA